MSHPATEDLKIVRLILPNSQYFCQNKHIFQFGYMAGFQILSTALEFYLYVNFKANTINDSLHSLLLAVSRINSSVVQNLLLVGFFADKPVRQRKLRRAIMEWMPVVITNYLSQRIIQIEYFGHEKRKNELSACKDNVNDSRKQEHTKSIITSEPVVNTQNIFLREQRRRRSV